MNKIITLLFVFAFYSNMTAQTTAIPDTAFEQKLIALGVDSDGAVNGQILNSDATAVNRLVLVGGNISDLTGIEAFVNLDTFYCYNNQITSLDLSSNVTLDLLNCSNNQLTSLDVLSNIALERLDCSINQLTSLDISSNTLLTTLFCNSNQLTSLDISPCINLLDFGCSDNQLTSLDVSSCPFLNALACSSNQLTSLDVSINVDLFYFECNNNRPFFRICVSNLNYMNLWVKDATAAYVTDCYPKAIEGNITIDSNSNCLADTLEQRGGQHIVHFEQIGTGATYDFSTDTAGYYVAYLDTGTYIVTIAQSNPYWQICPSSQQITVDTNYVIQTVDWSLQTLVSCAALEVDVAAPFLRMTGGGSHYTVSYCNNGTKTASNVYVEVDIDTDLNVLGSSIPIVSQVGSIYRFNIGNVDVFEYGSFSINVKVDTSAQFE
ncbi:MAG: hypothetical protein GY810_12175 [Aureispira sp.]|nr:hypothetical protein [Aureispira sp.]